MLFSSWVPTILNIATKNKSNYLEKSSVHFVHEKNGLDTFSNGLTQDSFGLHADTWKKDFEIVKKGDLGLPK